MKKDDLFLRIRALAHSIDTLLSYSEDEAVACEDVNILSMMMVELIDEYDRIRVSE